MRTTLSVSIASTHSRVTESEHRPSNLVDLTWLKLRLTPGLWSNRFACGKQYSKSSDLHLTEITKSSERSLRLSLMVAAVRCPFWLCTGLSAANRDSCSQRSKHRAAATMDVSGLPRARTVSQNIRGKLVTLSAPSKLHQSSCTMVDVVKRYAKTKVPCASSIIFIVLHSISCLSRHRE